jgi:uncharacterized membrane protein
MLKEIDRRYVGYTVVYLAFVALLPFPTSVLGEFPQNPISVAVFALNMAIISSLEAALFHYAWRKGLLDEELPAEVERWALKLSLFPVVMFAISVPVAFLNTWLGVALWFGSVPFQAWLLRRRPSGADRYSI